MTFFTCRDTQVRRVWIFIGHFEISLNTAGLTAQLHATKVNFHCMEKGLVMSMRFVFSNDWNDVPCKSLFFISGNDVISLESRPLNFHVIFIQAYSLGPQTYFRSSLTHVLNQFRNKIKRKYPEEYVTINKVGSEKPLASKSCLL